MPTYSQRTGSGWMAKALKHRKPPQEDMNESKALTTTKASALNVMASKFSVDPTKLLQTLKSTVFSGASDDELMALVVVSNEYGLNPFLKEIYAFPKKGGGIQPLISVDGWVRMMNSNPSFDGIEFEFSNDEGDMACTATIHIKGRSKPVRVTEYKSECERNTDPWKTCPRRMLRHKALIQACRVAFGFSGAFEADSPEAIEVHVEPVPATNRHEPPRTAIAESATDTAQSMPSWEKLGITIEEAGLTFADFKAWAAKGGQVQGISDAQSWADVPEADAARLLRAKGGMITAIQAAKGGAK